MRTFWLRENLPPRAHTITDAALEGGKVGLGAAIFFKKESGSKHVRSWMRHCPASELLGCNASIYDLEAATVAFALDIFKITNCSITIHCDNKAACRSLCDAKGATPIAMASAMALHEYLQNNGISARIRYIHTERNGTDS